MSDNTVYNVRLFGKDGSKGFRLDSRNTGEAAQAVSEGKPLYVFTVAGDVIAASAGTYTELTAKAEKNQQAEKRTLDGNVEHAWSNLPG